MTDPAPAMSVSRYGRRVVAVYLVVCALALIAMLVETVSGHAGTASMFAAFLAVPWSMLVAGLAPPLPHDWPMAAGLAVRMLPLALFMLLNAAIISGIAGRSERDLTSRGARAGVFVLAATCALFGSGCSLATRQVVFVSAPVQALDFFFNGFEESLGRFDFTTSPQWVEQHGDIVRLTDLTIMGDFENFVAIPIDVRIAVSPDSIFGLTSGVATWGPLRLDSQGIRRVEWSEGQRLMLSNASTLLDEVRGDGNFTLYTSTTGFDGQRASSQVRNMRLAAVFELK